MPFDSMQVKYNNLRLQIGLNDGDLTDPTTHGPAVLVTAVDVDTNRLWVKKDPDPTYANNYQVFADGKSAVKLLHECFVADATYLGSVRFSSANASDVVLFNAGTASSEEPSLTSDVAGSDTVWFKMDYQDTRYVSAVTKREGHINSPTLHLEYEDPGLIYSGGPP